MKTFWIIFMLLLNSINILAQDNLSNRQIDSIINGNSEFVYENPERYYTSAKKTYEASLLNKYDKGIALSLRKISLYHSEILKNYNTALTYTDQGLELSKKINNDSLTLYFTFGRGALYGKLGFLKRAVKIIDECLSKTDAIKDPKKRSLLRGDLYSHKALFLSSIKPEHSTKLVLENNILAMKEYEKALEECLDAGYANVGYSYMQLGDYDKAIYYFNKSIQFFKIKNVITPEVEYTNLAELYYRKGEYPKSLSYADSSNDICLKMKTKNYFLISENYKNFKKIYTKLDSSAASLKFYNLELLYKDSLNLENEKQLSASAKYMIDKNENENSALHQKNYYMIIGFALFLLAGIILFYYYTKHKKTNFDKEVKIKEKDIETKSTEIVELKHKVSNSYTDLIEMAKQNDPLFTSFFIELYPDFYKNLKAIQPNLTLVEQKTCFYLKLKLTTKEIADYTFVSVKAIQNRKNRLRKRLLIEGDIDIYEWINEL